MKCWKADKAKSDRYLPTIKSILGQVLIDEPPVQEDEEHNTDLIVLQLGAVRVACRIRDYGYLGQRDYANEFTIRAARPSGQRTELGKIIEGWGDYVFYGFGAQAGCGLSKWTIGDLKVFRLWFATQMACNGGKQPGSLIPNGDKSSTFRAFRWDDLPAEFVVASGGEAFAQTVATN